MDLGIFVFGLSGITGIPVVMAFSLGLLTAISPCPLATNIAAMAYVGQGVADRRYALITSALYTLGRMLAYSVLGVLIIKVGLEVPGVASLLQNTGERILGPILIAVGATLLNINRIRFGSGSAKLSSIGSRVGRWGMVGGFLLGILFALAFCPYSAILYFGVLIPMAFKTTGGIALPPVFAIGTGIPVLIFGASLSLGVSRVSTWFNALTRAQNTIRIITSLTLMGVGIYYMMLWLQA